MTAHWDAHSPASLTRHATAATGRSDTLVRVAHAADGRGGRDRNDGVEIGTLLGAPHAAGGGHRDRNDWVEVVGTLL